MSTHKHIDRICCIVIILAVILTILFMNGESLGISAMKNEMGYESRLFDTSCVHTIDIVMDDWDSFIKDCEDEEYETCSVVIDNELYKNVAIRAKGNTSLSQVSALNSERYSFKVEFDHYDSSKSYYGLDKLSLNNIIQDNTYLKDYISYRMMAEYDVAAPLCSFVYITVNGEDWGLYLAVEAVEESFLERNYGNDYGELYKPDSSDIGGGRGEGKDFDFASLNEQTQEATGELQGSIEQNESDLENGQIQQGKRPDAGFGFGQMQQNEKTENGDFDANSMPQRPEDAGNIGKMEIPENVINGEARENQAQNVDMPDDGDENGEMPEGVFNKDNLPDGMFGEGEIKNSGMGSDDVKLKYIDDDIDSYSNIFDNAKTDVTKADKNRLINSLKNLSQNTDIDSTVDIDKVIRYFVVHNFLCNDDSYTGTMVHNYYLYEDDGMLSMIPWDYNLAFGGFQSSSATSTVNSPIDSPVTGGDTDDRPMVGWIFESEEYTELYHEYYKNFISEWFSSGAFEEEINSVTELIKEYVKKDPTKFCTYEEFEKAVDTLKEFCSLRVDSVNGQLDGSIPSTLEAQTLDSSSLIDASSINISDMGAMENGQNGMKGEFAAKNTADELPEKEKLTQDETESDDATAADSDNITQNKDMSPPNNMGNADTGQMMQNSFEAESDDATAADSDNITQNKDMLPPNNMGNAGMGQMMQNPFEDNSQKNDIKELEDMPEGTTNNGISLDTLIILGACILTLIGGILLTKIYKR